MIAEQKEYFKRLSNQFIKEITPPNEFKRFVDNNDLLGKYIESAVRIFIKKIISNGKISTGGVISPENPLALNQIDVIIWKPNPFPAIFDSENFAIVPKNSVFGLIEIKSSNYSGVKDKIEIFCSDEKFKTLVKKENINNINRLLSIICLYDNSKDNGIKKLVDNGKCIVLFNLINNEAVPNTIGIIEFIEFLIYIDYDLSVTFDIFKGFN